jgi:hypothetical protein
VFEAFFQFEHAGFVKWLWGGNQLATVDINARMRQGFLAGTGAVAVYCLAAGDVDAFPPVPVMIGCTAELERVLADFAAFNSEPVSIVHAAWLFDARAAERIIGRAVDEWTNLAQHRRGFWFNVPPSAAILVLAGITKEFGAYSMTLERMSERLSGIPQEIAMLIHTMKQRGELKPVNESYKSYRLAAGARGEPVATWSSFLDDYRVLLAQKLGEYLRTSAKL